MAMDNNIQELENLDIDLDNYEVIRQEYFGGTNEPQFTFSKGRAYINGSGLRAMEYCEYVNLLFDREKKTLVVKKSAGKSKDSLRWCTSGKKKKPRRMRCIPLYYLIYEMMGWDVDNRYRINGFMKSSKDVDILFFDLNDAICFAPTGRYDERGREIVIEHFPKQWEGCFGILQMESEKKEYVSVYEDEMRFDVELLSDKRMKEKVEKA